MACLKAQVITASTEKRVKIASSCFLASTVEESNFLKAFFFYCCGPHNAEGVLQPIWPLGDCQR